MRGTAQAKWVMAACLVIWLPLASQAATASSATSESKTPPNMPALPLFRLPDTTSPLSLPSLPTTTATLAGKVAPTVAVRSRLDPDERRFHLGAPIHLFVELSWQGDAGDVVPEAPEEPILTNIAKKGIVHSSQIMSAGETHRVAYTYDYVLEPTAEGPASIEPIQVRYRLRDGSDTLRLTTDRFALTILPRRWPWKKILLWFAGAVATVGVTGVFVLGLVAHVRRRRKAAKVPPPPSPFEQMRGDLERIQRLFTEGVARDACDVAERLVRKALGRKVGAELGYATISELSERLGNEALDPVVCDRAASILDRCSQVKFAGYAPTVADQNQILADCRLLLDDLERQGGTPTAER